MDTARLRIGNALASEAHSMQLCPVLYSYPSAGSVSGLNSAAV
jgi:hypothetical protein